MASLISAINQCWRPSLGAALISLSLGACAGLPDVSERAASIALESHPRTTLAKTVQPAVAAHPGLSGARLLKSGEDAFASRLVLADAAERSLDVQYYIWKDDLTGKVLTQRLLRAADRGVRVRVLFDDIGSKPSDQNLLALDSHPNLEVRLFNPVVQRSPKLLGMMLEFGRINRRMHNKSFTADGQVSILGGRNIGDEYFAADEVMNFSDLDVAMIGPAVKEVSKAFDLYWNNQSAIGITDLARGSDPEKDLAAMRTELAAHEVVAKNSPYANQLRGSMFDGQLKSQLPYHWGSARIVYDDPDKVATSARDPRTHMAPALRAEAMRSKEELFMVSPYFVPGKEGVANLAALRERGPRVVVITNSLASTDSAAVHGGYKGYRKPLLRAGIELYELKPTPGVHSVRHGWSTAASLDTSLHSKTYSIDRRTLFVGSYNLDPRSKRLNTEIGALLDCPELASYLPETVDPALATETYRLELDGRRLVWVTQEDGKEVRYDHEPATSFWQRFNAEILSWLPIEGLL